MAEDILPQKPTLALCLILGGSAFRSGSDGAAVFANCLSSLASVAFDQIVIVDTGINEDAKLIIGQASRERMQSGLSEIEVYRFRWRDDFAAARNAALSHVQTKYWFWCDADDVLENAAGLRDLVAEADEQNFGAVHLRYDYQFDDNGNCLTRHQ